MAPTALISGIFAAFGGAAAWIAVLLFLSESPGEWFLGMPLLLVAGVYLMAGISGLMELMKKVHLVPQGIAVTMRGKTIAQYPVEEIGMFFAVEWWEKGWVRILGISRQTPEEITGMRERQLQRGVFTRDELKFRKRDPNWQRTFRQEYLLKRGRLAWLMPWKKDILWLELTPDNIAMLRYWYPEIPWEYLRRKDDEIGAIHAWEDSNPMVFSRARNAAPKNEKISMAVFAAAMIVLVLLTAFVDDLQLLSLLVVEFGLIFGILIYAGRGDSDMFYLSQTGIRIKRGAKEHAAFFAQDIRTFLKYEGGGVVGEFGGKSILVSTMTTAELAQQWAMTDGSGLSAATKEIPGWLERQLFWFCAKRGRKARENNSACQSLSWNSGREQTLRKLYPDAVWIDLTPNVIYQLSF